MTPTDPESSNPDCRRADVVGLRCLVESETDRGAKKLPGDDGRGAVRVGVSSWSDRSLTHESDWYPKRTMKAAERIAFYSQQFDLVEMETTNRFPPTSDICRQWHERTPSGFKFDVQAWSLLTGQPTMPASLWPDLLEEVRPDKRDQPRLYPTHLSSDAIDECWRRFNHAVTPLVDNDKLGLVILRFPRWFVPRDRNREQLTFIASRLGGLPAAVQFSCRDWMAPEECESTLSLLDELGLAFVSVDADKDDDRGLGGIVATSSDIAVLRLLGRRGRSDDDQWWTPDWRGYRYSPDELTSIVRNVEHLAESAAETHILAGTCWRDDAVVNAREIAMMLAS